MICAALAVSACSRSENRVAFDGVFFKGKVSAARNDRQNFVSTVRQVSKSLQGARAAAEYEAIRHCLRYYGTSDITWVVGPETPDAQLTLDRDTLSYSGSCSE
jgi:hypothetical protein